MTDRRNTEIWEYVDQEAYVFLCAFIGRFGIDNRFIVTRGDGGAGKEGRITVKAATLLFTYPWYPAPRRTAPDTLHKLPTANLHPTHSRAKRELEGRGGEGRAM